MFVLCFCSDKRSGRFLLAYLAEHILASSDSLRSLHLFPCYFFATMTIPFYRLIGSVARALTCTAHDTSTPKRVLVTDCFIQLISSKSRGMTHYNARMTKGPICFHCYFVVCGELNKFSGPLAYYSHAIFAFGCTLCHTLAPFALANYSRTTVIV